MDTGNKRPNAAVDDILEELKGGARRPTGTSSANLDDILAELGVGKKPAAKPTAPAPRPAAPRQAAPSAPRPAPKAAPAPTPIAQPRPAAAAKAPAAAAPRQAQPAPQRPAQPAAEPAQAPAPKRKVSDTTILDIQVEHTQSGSRVGKAAALDRVDPDKYSGDTELLSWFSGEQSSTMSKKDRRRLEKERKKQEAADRKAAKRSGRADFEAEEADELPPLPSLAATRREQAPEPAPRPRAEAPRPKAPEVDENGDWTVTGDLFADEEAAPVAKPVPPVQRPVTPAAAPRPMAQPVAPAQAPQPRPNAQAPVQAAVPPPARPVATPQQAAPVAPATPAPVAARPQGGTQVFQKVDAPKGAPGALPADMPDEAAASVSYKLQDTKTYDFSVEEEEEHRVPTAAFTQEFDSPEQVAPQAAAPAHETENKSLYLDDMVDDKVRAFFGETVMVDKDDLENTKRQKRRRSRTKSLFTGEFAQLEKQMEEGGGFDGPEEDENDYNRPQDAEAVENDLVHLRTSLTQRLVATGVLTVLLLWLGLAYAAILPVPGFMSPVLKPTTFGVVYLLLAFGLVAANFNTVAAGLIGLVGQPTVDSAPSLAAIGALLQGVVVLVSQITKLPGEEAVTLFGALAGFVLCFNLVGKRLRAVTTVKNFQLASAGFDHSAGYIVDGARQELAYHITDGLQEDDPVLLVSRPTQLVKGFMRQSFSLRWSDGIGRVLGWVLVGVALVAAVVSFILKGDMLLAVSCFAGAACIAAPFSSTLVSAVPAMLMQQGTSKVGAVVPGWSAIEELGDVNVVMAGARDIFPPSSVQLKGIKTYQKERIDVAILYAASVLIEACDTMRDIFVGVIQGKNDMLYKVESLTTEPGQGFTAWVENHRVVIGTREMLKKHDITPPPIESEMQYVKSGSQPVYLAVSGKLCAMFVVKYSPDEEVALTLESLVKSGVSLLVTSDDMNVTDELIQTVYGLPAGVVKALGRRELDLLEPMTSYIPESEGVMTHIGTFTSFIGGMSAAASCAASERMSVIVQIAAVAVAGLISLVLAFSGGLAALSMAIALLFQISWTLLVCVLPFARQAGLGK